MNKHPINSLSLAVCAFALSVTVFNSDAMADYLYCTYDGGSYLEDIGEGPHTHGGGYPEQCFEEDGHTNVVCYLVYSDEKRVGQMKQLRPSTYSGQ